MATRAADRHDRRTGCVKRYILRDAAASQSYHTRRFGWPQSTCGHHLRSTSGRACILYKMGMASYRTAKNTGPDLEGQKDRTGWEWQRVRV